MRLESGLRKRGNLKEERDSRKKKQQTAESQQVRAIEESKFQLHQEKGEMEIGRGVKQCRKDIAIYWHKHCVDHAIANHPEQPARVSSILQELRRHWSEEIFREAPLVTEDQIRLFHSAEHISKLNTLSCRAQIAHEKKLPNRVQMIDQDTMVMHHTLEAA